MKDYERWIVDATKFASRSPQKRFNTGAVAVMDGKMVSAGWSHIGMRLKESYSTHAEIHALGRARHLNLSGAVMFVANIAAKSGNTTLARPCVSCAVAMYSAGIRKVYYTVDSATTSILDLSIDLQRLDLYRAVPASGNILDY